MILLRFLGFPRFNPANLENLTEIMVQDKFLWALRKISMGIEILRNGRRNRFV